MSRHYDFTAHVSTIPSFWLNTLQEFISTLAVNLQVQIASTSSVKIPASADNGQVGVGISGRWRYVSADVTAAHPGGVAGNYDLYVTASDNSFTPTDTTDYTFGLVILPTGTLPVTALYRKIGVVVWAGSVGAGGITDVQLSVGHAGLTALQVAGAILLAGTFAARPAASAANTGVLYFATDTGGGTLYRSTGAAWAQVAASVLHAAAHAPGGSDALPWTTIHGSGTAAARPAAAATNAGYLYYSTDTGDLSRSTGAAWASVPTLPFAHAGSHLAGGSDAIAWTTVIRLGTLASRPAAGPTNTGYLYVASDVAGGTLYRSDGSTWTQIAMGATASKKYAADVGDGVATSINVVHNLGTADVIVQVHQNTGGSVAFPGIAIVDANTVQLTFSVAPAANSIRVVILG